MFPAIVSSIEYIRASKLRALAVTTARRSELLPDIPTVAEFVAGYEADNWFGVCAPNATPAAIVEKLNKEINAGLGDANMNERATCRTGWRRARALACRLWQAHRRGYRESGEIRGH